jgi:hypothetical protein
MAVASTRAQNAVRLADKLTTRLPAIASSLNSIMCAALTIVGAFDLDLILGGVLAARAFFADSDGGPTTAVILLSAAGTAFRSSRGRLLAAVIVPSSLTGGLVFYTAAGGSSAVAQCLQATRNRATAKVRSVVNKTTCS